MNSITVALIISFISAYMLTVSYHSFYLHESVLLLEQQKQSVYYADWLLAFGVSYYKKYGEQLHLPCTIRYELDGDKKISGTIFFRERDHNSIEIEAVMKPNIRLKKIVDKSISKLYIN